MLTFLLHALWGLADLAWELKWWLLGAAITTFVGYNVLVPDHKIEEIE